MLPTPLGAGAHTVQARGLYDPCLALILDAPTAGSDLTVDNQVLVMVTGANQEDMTMTQGKLDEELVRMSSR